MDYAPCLHSIPVSDDLGLSSSASADTVSAPALRMRCSSRFDSLTYVSLKTNASTHALILALAMHPEVQRKAQAELDNVVGPDRLPEFSDRDALPYVNAIVKEIVRWHAVAPVGGAHRSEADDEYNGYFIPAKSIIIPNQWCAGRVCAVVTLG